MASTRTTTVSVSSVWLCPKAAHQNNRSRRPTQTHSTTINPNNRATSQSKSKSKSNKQARRYTPPPQPLSPLPGGDATTFTRLPPIDDDLHDSHSSLLKLSDSIPPVIHHHNQQLRDDEVEDEAFDPHFPTNYKLVEVFEANPYSQEFDVNEQAFHNNSPANYNEFDQDEDDDDQAFDPNFPGNYKVLQVFEGNPFSEQFDDDDDDDEDDIFDGKNVNFNQGVQFLNHDNGDLEQQEGEEEELEVKEKGVPAVMRCFDRAKIYVRAGDGGNGVVAFRREKFVPFGGPSGGDGGRGGNVYVEVDGSMSSLLPFRNSVHFRAGRGSHGQGKVQSGAKGEDVVVKVAPGTLIREAGREEVLLEMVYPGQRALLLPGGRGGRGNASFKSGSNKVPKIAENGEQGPEMLVPCTLQPIL